jgi:GNAT superfamily N-acetyltransferase
LLSLRRYTPADQQQCVDLLQRGHDPKFTAERFQWLHHQNPLAPSDIALVVDGENIAGFYGALKKKAVIDGQEYILARDIDPVVDPNYRGKGLFGKMLEFSLETFTDIDFFYNFANNASAPGFIKKGWQSIGPLRDHISQVGYDSVFSRQFPLYLTSSSMRKKGLSGSVKEFFFDSLNKNELNPVCPEGKIWVKRDMEFIRWRYLMNPMKTYNFYALTDNDTIKSICVVRFLSEKKHLLIIDYFHTEGADEGLSPYLPYFNRVFGEVSVYTWQTSTNSMLRGFITNPFKKKIGQNFLVRSFPGKTVPERIYEIKNWYVTRGDSEVF